MFSETCPRRCPLECRDGAAMSEHCHQRRTRQLCRLTLQAASPVAAAANDPPFGHNETLGNLRSCKSHRRAAACCIRGMSTASARARLDSPTKIRQMLEDQTCHAALLDGAIGAAQGGNRSCPGGHLSPEPSRVASSLNVSITRRVIRMCIHSISKEMERDSAATSSQLLIASSEIGQSFNITITTCSWGVPGHDLDKNPAGLGPVYLWLSNY